MGVSNSIDTGGDERRCCMEQQALCVRRTKQIFYAVILLVVLLVFACNSRGRSTSGRNSSPARVDIKPVKYEVPPKQSSLASDDRRLEVIFMDGGRDVGLIF